MAFVVETGSGSATANSYLSVADADTYHTDHGDSSDWSGSTEAQKQEALRLATQYLDAKYDGRWKGTRSNEDQALDHPRTGIVDSDGYIYDSDALAQCLLDATAELARRVREGDTLLDDIGRPGIFKSKRVKVGPIDTTKVYVGGGSQVKTYPLIERLLSHLITDNTMVYRG